MQEKVAKFDQRIQAALGDLTKKELQLGKIRSEMRVMQNAKDVVEKQLQELKEENNNLQSNLQKQRLQNNRLVRSLKIVPQLQSRVVPLNCLRLLINKTCSVLLVSSYAVCMKNKTNGYGSLVLL